MSFKIGSIIQSIRKKRGLTQLELAKQIGSTQAYVSNIEQGKVHPSHDLLAQISIALNVPAPVIQYLALDLEDIPELKQKQFKSLQTPMNEIVTDAFGL